MKKKRNSTFVNNLITYLIVIVAFIPLLNTILTGVGFIYAAVNGYGPTGADIGEWFKARFKKKGE